MTTDADFTSGVSGLTFDEMKTQFTAWALMKSPLLFVADVSVRSPSVVE